MAQKLYAKDLITGEQIKEAHRLYRTGEPAKEYHAYRSEPEAEQQDAARICLAGAEHNQPVIMHNLPRRIPIVSWGDSANIQNHHAMAATCGEQALEDGHTARAASTCSRTREARDRAIVDSGASVFLLPVTMQSAMVNLRPSNLRISQATGKNKVGAAMTGEVHLYFPPRAGSNKEGVSITQTAHTMPGLNQPLYSVHELMKTKKWRMSLGWEDEDSYIHDKSGHEIPIYWAQHHNAWEVTFSLGDTPHHARRASDTNQLWEGATAPGTTDAHTTVRHLIPRHAGMGRAGQHDACGKARDAHGGPARARDTTDDASVGRKREGRHREHEAA